MKYLLFISSLFIISNVSAQAVITKKTSTASLKSIKDFGAIPDDGKDDTWAFIKAGKYFSNIWDINGVPLKPGVVNFSYATNSAELRIPSGTYLVGKQVKMNCPDKDQRITYGSIFNDAKAKEEILIAKGSANIYGMELIKLTNARNDIDQLVIKKDPAKGNATRPVIRYNNGLTLGYIDCNGAQQFISAAEGDQSYTKAKPVNIGSFVEAINCKNIAVQDIVVDGNNAEDKMNYKGGWKNENIQVGASGILLRNTVNVTISNMDILRMSLDGIVYHHFYRDTLTHKNQPLSNFSISNTRCDYNRRQGFSWVGGRHVVVKESQFNNTGQGFSAIAVGNPGAGVDIEPETDGELPIYCIDGVFINCSFINNKGVGMLSDESAQLRAKDMQFINCKFHDVDGYAVWIKGKAFSFTNCKIWGGFVYGNSGNVKGEETIFTNCDFADEEISSRPGVYNKGAALVESWQVAKRMRFSGCTFRTIHDEQRMAAVFGAGRTEEDFNVFSNCSFICGSGIVTQSVLFGATFDGNTTFSTKNLQHPQQVLLNGIVITGSANACKPNKFTLNGSVFLWQANTNGAGLTQMILGRSNIGAASQNGYLDFTVNNNSCFYTYIGTALDIGRNSRLINKAGGQLAAFNTVINNDGKMILESGSYLEFVGNTSMKLNKETNGVFCYDKNIITGLKPLYVKNLGDLGKANKFIAGTDFPASPCNTKANVSFCK